MKLLTQADSNPKAEKCVAYGWLPIFHHLAPSKLSGRNVCPFATPGCSKPDPVTGDIPCLTHQGNPAWRAGKDRARIERTRMLFADRREYVDRLIDELYSHLARAKRLGLRPCCRLNATSDLRWESMAPRIFREFPRLRFYDYTKIPNRIGKTPENYYLCFSRSETAANHRECARVLAGGGSVVAVVKDRGLSQYKALHPFPRRHEGFPVTDGDKHDLRFKDRAGYTFLRAKGTKMRADTTGFAINLTDWSNSK